MINTNKNKTNKMFCSGFFNYVFLQNTDTLDYRDLEIKLDTNPDKNLHNTLLVQPGFGDMYSTTQWFTDSTLVHTECTGVKINNNTHSQDENRKYFTLSKSQNYHSPSPSPFKSKTFL